MTILAPRHQILSPFSIFGWSPVSVDQAFKSAATAAASATSSSSSGLAVCRTRSIFQRGQFSNEKNAGTFQEDGWGSCVSKRQDIFDRVVLMMEQEISDAYKRRRYLRELEALNRSFSAVHLVGDDAPQPVIVEERHYVIWRKQMFDWAFNAIGVFGLQSDVVEIAFSYLDRYIATCVEDVGFRQGGGGEEQRSSPLIPVRVAFDGSKEMFQLATMTALYIACKIHDVYSCCSIPTKSNLDVTDGQDIKTKGDELSRPSGRGSRLIMTIDALVAMSRGNFNRVHFQLMEQDMLDRLDFRLNPPTTTCFVSSVLEYCLCFLHDNTVEQQRKRRKGFSKTKDEDKEHLRWVRRRYKMIEEKCLRYSQLAMRDYSFAFEKVSVLAVASILIAINDDDDDSAHSFLKESSNSDFDTVRESTRRKSHGTEMGDNSIYSAIASTIINTLDNYNVVRGLAALGLQPDGPEVLKCGRKLQRLLVKGEYAVEHRRSE